MKKFIISAFLVVSLILGSVIPAFAAVDPVGVASVATEVMTTIIQHYFSSSVSAAQKQAELNAYKDFWVSSTSVCSSIEYVSYDALSDLCVQLIQNGQPCQIVYSSSYNAYFIRATLPFGHGSVNGSNGFGSTYVWNNTGYYFVSGFTYVCAHYNTDAALFSTLEGTVYSVADYTKHIFNRLGTIADLMKTTLDGATYSMADMTKHIYNRIGTLDTHIDGWLHSKSEDGTNYSVADWTKHIYNRLGTINTNLGGKLDTANTRLSTINTSITSGFTTLGGYVDGLEGKLDTVNSNLSTIKGRLLKTGSDGTTYTAADLLYNIYTRLGATNGYIDGIEGYVDGLEGKVDTANTRLSTLDTNLGTRFSTLNSYVDDLEGKIDTTNTRLSTINSSITSGFSGIGGKMDTVINLMTTNAFVSGYSSDSSGTAFPTQSLPYEAATQIVARLNSEMIGRSVKVLKRDGSGSSDITLSRAAIASNGCILVYSSSASYYYLCDSRNTIFISDPKTDYSNSLDDIYSRMSDLIAAINNLTVGIDLSDVSLEVDASSINLFNNDAYCCGYQTDSNGNKYATYAIPYDTATALIERFNTDYVGKRITAFSRNGSSSVGYLRSATLLSSGYIQVKLTNGYSYYLCDNTNVLYIVDSTSNYGNRLLMDVSSFQAQQLAYGQEVVAKLDTINESINNLELSVDVIQDVQQYDDDVDNGIDALSQILDLVREFFNPGIETDWGQAKNYAMQWGSDAS